MGLNLGAAADSEDGQPILDINTTPLIDVLLVLLVMLIITIPVQLHAVNLNMQTGTPPPAEPKAEVVELHIDQPGAVYWNGLPVANRTDLETKMGAAAAQGIQPEIHIAPHKQAPYAAFAEVLSSASRHGLVKLAVAGSEPNAEH